MKAVRALNVLAVARDDPRPRGFFYNKNLMMLFSRGLPLSQESPKSKRLPRLQEPRRALTHAPCRSPVRTHPSPANSTPHCQAASCLPSFIIYPRPLTCRQHLPGSLPGGGQGPAIYGSIYGSYGQRCPSWWRYLWIHSFTCKFEGQWMPVLARMAHGAILPQKDNEGTLPI